MTEKLIVHEDDIEWEDYEEGSLFGDRTKRLAAAAGGAEIGASLIEVPPGRSSCPFHYHLGNEEAIYVLSGRGTLRLRSGTHRVRAGCYVALPRGAEGVHQVINDSDAPLRFLCLSTMNEPDVAVYPDSRKIGVFAGSAPGGSQKARTYVKFLDEEATVDYWEREATE